MIAARADATPTLEEEEELLGSSTHFPRTAASLARWQRCFFSFFSDTLPGEYRTRKSAFSCMAMMQQHAAVSNEYEAATKR